jgi:hypothetical protein
VVHVVERLPSRNEALNSTLSTTKKKKKVLVVAHPQSQKQNKPGTGTHACNPSYSGARDQENRSSKPVQANKTLSQKNPSHKTAGRVAPHVGLEFKPRYCKKKKKERKKQNSLPGLQSLRRLTEARRAKGPTHIPEKTVLVVDRRPQSPTELCE